MDKFLLDIQALINEQKLFSKKDKLLLACSGGVDSMVLASVLIKLNYQVQLAHCNFQLRAKESDADELLVTQFAKKNKLKLFTKRFNTKEEQNKSGRSIQEIARKLRYEWFEQLIKGNEIDYLVTAHHSDDVIETFFINLIRTSGIKGLQSIPLKTKNIVRPLLNCGKTEIIEYAKTHSIKYNEDSSNTKNDYLRNALRNKAIPLLSTIDERFKQGALNSIKNLQSDFQLLNYLLAEEKKKYIKTTNDLIYILKDTPTHILNNILLEYNFTESLHTKIQNTKTGALFQNEKYKLNVDRVCYIISDAQLTSEIKPLEFNSLVELLKNKSIISTKKLKSIPKELSKKNDSLILNISQISWPLKIRKWQHSDKIKPFGLKGSKLVSDILQEQKLSRFEKDTIWILLDANEEILWIPNIRTSRKCELIGNSDQLISITVR